MAELWLAKLNGTAGFAKLVAVKRILPQLAGSERFARMFLDEGRIAADLRHPNIVQVLEAGSASGELFIAIELLEGMDAGKLMSRVLARGERLPLASALQIVIDAARGLDYAHKKASFDGEPLEIVHRDVSPQNIFVTVDGHAKVLDFGIAKARCQTTLTEAGVLKGKCGYMAPEMVMGDPIDHRSDQFALGVVLWELVVGQRLFRRESDVETLRAVIRADVPLPSTIVDGVPPDIEAIIMRVLDTAPSMRFEDCAHLADALDDFLDEQRLRRGPRAVAHIVRERLHDPVPQGNEASEKTLPTKLYVGPHSLSQSSPSEAATPQRSDSLADAVTNDDVSSSAVEAREGTDKQRRFGGARRDDGGATMSSRAPPALGKMHESEALRAALDDAMRAGASGAGGPVTLVGPAGVGKTHLARAFLDDEREAGHAPGGVYVVEMEGAESAEDVVTLLAFALGLAGDGLSTDVHEVGMRAARALAARGKSLVVVDGADTLAHEAAACARGVSARGKVGVIVTARAALGVRGERVVEVGPLSHAASVELLLASAGLDATHAKTAGELAQSAGGLPSALLLAGRWLAERNAQGALWTSRTPDEMQRRTGDHPLQMLFDGSLQMLDDESRSALLRLAVHRGPLDHAIVDELVPERSPKEVLGGLRAASVVVGDEIAPAPRERALDELAARGELLDARNRHAAVVAAHVAREVVHLDEPAHAPLAFAAIERMRPAIEDALDALLAHDELDDEGDARVLQLALALDAVVARRGASPAHLRLLDEALGHASERVDRSLRARALEARADHEKLAGRSVEARRDYLLALELTTGDSVAAAILHRNVADLALDDGNLVDADTHARKAVAAARAVTTSARARLLARGTWTLARIALRRGDAAAAELLLEQAIDTFEHDGDERFAARARFELGRCAEARGDANGAREIFAKAIVEHKAQDDALFLEKARVHLALVQAWLGDVNEARALLEAARDGARARGDGRAERAITAHLDVVTGPSTGAPS